MMRVEFTRGDLSISNMRESYDMNNEENNNDDSKVEQDNIFEKSGF